MDRIAMYRKYLAEKPDDRFAMYSLALELKKQGAVEEAEAAFRRLLEVHPTSGAGHFQLGELLREHGRPREAMTSWQAGLRALRGVNEPEARRSRSEIQGALDQLEDELEE